MYVWFQVWLLLIRFSLFVCEQMKEKTTTTNKRMNEKENRSIYSIHSSSLTLKHEVGVINYLLKQFSEGNNLKQEHLARIMNENALENNINHTSKNFYGERQFLHLNFSI